MTLSLTPNPDNEAADLATELSVGYQQRVLREHGASYGEFMCDRSKEPEEPVTLQELRDWLGY